MMAFAVLAVVKATVVCALAFLFSHLCRRTRASVRHLLFLLAFAALIVIPPASLVLPAAAITVPVTATTSDQTRPMDFVGSPGADADAAASSSTSDSRSTTHTSFATLEHLAAAVWLTGVALFLTPVLAGLWQLHRLRESASPWANGQALVRTLAPMRRLQRRIDVLGHKSVTGPMTCGFFKPAIILPAIAEDWDDASLRCAIGHELEHVARRDFLTLCLSRIVCAVYWFHPLVWAAWKRLRLEAERACDDSVLREADARDYASLLVSIAQRQAAGTRQPLLAMAGRDDLSARVAAVLDNRQTRGRVGRRRAMGLIVTGAIAIFAVTPITIAREIPQMQARATSSALRFETVSLKRNRGNDWRSARSYFTEHADGRPGVGPDGRVQWMKATNVPARLLLWLAYISELGGHGIGGPYQIDNAPEWIDSDRFDVVAKAPSRAIRQQMQEMLRSFMAERFKLQARIGSKDFPIYALVRSRSDGHLGPRMLPSQTDCSSKSGGSSACGLSSTTGKLVGRGVTMPQLVKILPNHLSGAHHIGLDRRIVERTDLSGAFDFTLEWTPDPVPREFRTPSEAPQHSLSHRFFAFPVEAKAPNFVAALQNQLGLMLETQWAPEPVLVVERIEPPVED